MKKTGKSHRVVKDQKEGLVGQALEEAKVGVKTAPQAVTGALARKASKP